VERLGCSEEVTRIWRDELVASYYIARVARTIADAITATKKEKSIRPDLNKGNRLSKAGYRYVLTQATNEIC